MTVGIYFENIEEYKDINLKKLEKYDNFEINNDKIICDWNDKLNESWNKMYGGNIGNNLFRFSTINMFNDNVKISAKNYKITDKKIDALIIPAANWIDGSWNNQNITNIINYFSVPVILIGLGAQTINGVVKFDLPSHTKKMLDLILQNPKSKILVRGKNTLNVLKHFGYSSNNIIKFGCPSLFLDDIKLNLINNKVSELLKNKKGNIAYYPSYYSGLEISDRYNLELLNENLFKTYNIIQSSKLIPIINEYRSNSNKNIDDIIDNLLLKDSIINKSFQLSSNLKNLFRNLNLEKAIYINNIYEQSFFLRNNINFSYGTRIHGAVLSLMSEIPTLLIYWDDRTRELSEELCIPAISQEKFKALKETCDHNTLMLKLISLSEINIKNFQDNLRNKKEILKEVFESYNINL